MDDSVVQFIKQHRPNFDPILLEEQLGVLTDTPVTFSIEKLVGDGEEEEYLAVVIGVRYLTDLITAIVLVMEALKPNSAWDSLRGSVLTLELYL